MNTAVTPPATTRAAQQTVRSRRWRPSERSMMRTLTHSIMTIAALAAGLTLTGAAKAQTASVAPSSLTETYGDWSVRCVSPAAAEGQTAPARVCEMTQALTQQGTGQRVLAMSLQSTEAGGSVTVVAPFGLLLSAGLMMDVAQVPFLEGAFRTCLPAGCVVVSDLDQADLDLLAGGDTAKVHMRSQNGEDLALDVSLTGFNAAWNRLLELS
jgi:invasion protein IalB